MDFENIKSYYTIIADKPKNKTCWISMIKLYQSTIRKVEILNNLLYITIRLKYGISNSDNMSFVLHFNDELELKRVYNDLIGFVN